MAAIVVMQLVALSASGRCGLATLVSDAEEVGAAIEDAVDQFGDVMLRAPNC